MRVSLIIPALNEGGCLGNLLAEAPVDQLHQLIVVDNGSSDNTAEVAWQAGAQVVAEPRRGYGFACAAGAAAADGDILAFMDGDGSFVPIEIQNLLKPIEQKEADLVLGSRLRDHSRLAALPAHQRFGNDLFTWLLRKRFGLKLTDLGPYRAIRRELLQAMQMQEYTYGWPLEMIIKAARWRKAIREIPVTYRPRLAGQSKVSGTLRGTILTAYRYSVVAIRYMR
jgi:glycosyltransferase involved in cell wall biosynthesis